jgi:hypothetical protein
MVGQKHPGVPIGYIGLGDAFDKAFKHFEAAAYELDSLSQGEADLVEDSDDPGELAVIEARTRVNRKMRDALAGGYLQPFFTDPVTGPTVYTLGSLEWLEIGLSIKLATVINRITNPGPTFLEGKTVYLENTNFEAWDAEACPNKGAESQPHAHERIAPDDALAIWPPGFPALAAKAPAVKPVPRAKRGRKIKYNWPTVREQAFKLLDERGDYEVVKRPDWRLQADLEKALLEFMGEDGGPAPSSLRASDKLPTWIMEWRQKQVSNSQ